MGKHIPGLIIKDQHLPYSMVGENCDRFGTARKLVEKILVADHTNNSSLFELTTIDGQNFN